MYLDCSRSFHEFSLRIFKVVLLFSYQGSYCFFRSSLFSLSHSFVFVKNFFKILFLFFTTHFQVAFSFYQSSFHLSRTFFESLFLFVETAYSVYHTLLSLSRTFSNSFVLLFKYTISVRRLRFMIFNHRNALHFTTFFVICQHFFW